MRTATRTRRQSTAETADSTGAAFAVVNFGEKIRIDGERSDEAPDTTLAGPHPLVLAVIVAVVFATGSPWWFPLVRGNHHKHTDQGLNVVGFTGSCSRFRVYAQNRWQPYGTKKMNAPDPLSTQIGGFSPNQTIAVDGWVHGRVAYPNNQPPWNSDVWFHVADGGWVSFAGVRALATSNDPTGLAGGGPEAAAPPSCEGAVH